MFKKLIIYLTIFTIINSLNCATGITDNRSALDENTKILFELLSENPDSRTHIGNVELFIDEDNVNAVDENGRTPLITAAINGWREAVDLLILKGADTHITNTDLIEFILNGTDRSNCASGGVNLANSDDPLLKEILTSTDILNRDKIITPFQRNDFTEKLEHFLRNYEGSDKTFNIWKQIVEKGAAVSDTLLETCLANPEIRTSINSLVIGKNWTDKLLKIELSQIESIRDMFNALPYLDILITTNAMINWDLVISNAFNRDSVCHEQNKLLALSIVYAYPKIINSNLINKEIERYITLLDLAIKNRSSYAVKKLLSNPYIKVNADTSNNITVEYEDDGNYIKEVKLPGYPLQYALRMKPSIESIKIICMLLKRGAWLINVEYNSKSDPTKYGARSFLDVKKTNAKIFEYICSLIKEKNYEGVAILLKDFNIAKAYPLALINAVKQQDEKLVDVLVLNDFDRNIKDSYSKTAMDYAKELKNEKIIRLLKLYQPISPTFLERLRGIGTKASV